MKPDFAAGQKMLAPPMIPRYSDLARACHDGRMDEAQQRALALLKAELGKEKRPR